MKSKLGKDPTQPYIYSVSDTNQAAYRERHDLIIDLMFQKIKMFDTVFGKNNPFEEPLTKRFLNL